MKAFVSVTMAVLMFARVAYAGGPTADPKEQELDHASDRPWADGVTKENQDEAIKFFKEGTDLLKEAFFTRAVDRYRKALTFWDHPAIHFNLAKALMNLDQPVDAYTHLGSSMKYGGAPLDQEQIAQVDKYMKLLYDTELAHLVITATEPGAVVSLDGKELFRAPGKWDGVAKADKHTILATKTGFQPAQIQKSFEPGKVTELKLSMVALETTTKYKREFAAWKPWAVIGGGAAVLIGGGLLMWQSSEKFAEYDAGIEKCNTDSATPILDDNGNEVGGNVSGCIPSSSLTGTKSTAETFQTIGIASLAVGGLTLATGFVLLYINREKPITVEAPAVSVTPVVAPDFGGVSATIRF